MPQQNGNNQLTNLGRGIEAFDFPVRLEPSLSTEPSSLVSMLEPIDDGRHPGLISRLFSRKPSSLSNVVSALDSPDVDEAPAYSMTEMAVSLLQSCIVTPETSERLLMNLVNPSVPTAFELISTDKEISVQFVVRSSIADRAKSHIKGFFPECRIVETPNNLRSLILTNKNAESLVIDFGLKRSALLPLNTSRTFDPDPLLGLIGAVFNLHKDELCVLQVLFQNTFKNWKEVLTRGLRNSRQANSAESNQLLTSSKEKFSRPVLCCVVRLCVVAASRERAVDIARGFAGTIQTLASPNGNELIALNEPSVPADKLLQSVVDRTSLRNGMLLNTSELASLVHLPSTSVNCSKLIRNNQKTKASPENTGDSVLTLGHNVHDGISKPVGISAEQLTRHIFVCGATGTGKSVFLSNSIRELVEKGFGCAAIDPAGDLIDDIISIIPDNRLDDVILFDASDSENAIGFNPLQAFTEAEKHLLSSDLVGMLKRYSTAWGALMEAAISHAVNAFLYNSITGDLFDLKRFLIEKDFRAIILQTVDDESTRYFWEKEASGINAKSLSSVLIRLDSFLRHPLIRNIVCQKESKLNFREIMDTGKIFLIKVSQGQIGQENASLLGSLLLSKFHQTALSRQSADARNRKLFVIAADEIQNYLSPSLGLCFAESRKFGVAIIAGTQNFRILQQNHDGNYGNNVAESINANSFVRICFRLGDDDAKRFAQGFSYFSSEDLQKLSVGHAIARIERADFDFNLTCLPPISVPQSIKDKKISHVVSNSRKLYGTLKEKLEAQFQRSSVPISVEKIERQRNRTNSPLAASTTSSTLEKLNEEPLVVPVALIQGSKASDRNNQQHRYLQTLIKKMAEQKNFRASVEKEIFFGAGRIDVALEDDVRKIACEISITNEPEYEVQNILKCLTAGYDSVIMISPDTKHLKKIRDKAVQELTDDQQKNVEYFDTDTFFTWLEKQTTTEPESVENFKGFKVKVNVKPSDANEQKNRKKAITSVVLDAMKRMNNEKSER